MIHSLSDVQSKNIGENTNIWQYCVVLPNARIGKNCNICSHCFIENDVEIGDNVTIKNGVSVYDGITIEDNVFIGPNVAFCNDRYPKSKNKNFKLEPIIIKKGASIGANATILPGVTIGENAMIGAGSVVTKDIEQNCIFITRNRERERERESKGARQKFSLLCFGLFTSLQIFFARKICVFRIWQSFCEVV